MTKIWAKGLALLLPLLLTACGSGPPPCGGAARGLLAPLCSPPMPEPPVNPAGSWAGTLTTDGAETEVFTADITQTGVADYEGVFTVGERTYNVTGFYSGTNSEGYAFTFQVPLAELGPTALPTINPGVAWSGQLTERGYSGGWFREEEDGTRSQTGTFTLERRP